MNIYTAPIAPLVWVASARDDSREYVAGGVSHEDCIVNLQEKLTARLAEIEAEADWIRKALAEKFPVST